jgi:hypothetical protein
MEECQTLQVGLADIGKNLSSFAKINDCCGFNKTTEQYPDSGYDAFGCNNVTKRIDYLQLANLTNWSDRVLNLSGLGMLQITNSSAKTKFPSFIPSMVNLTYIRLVNTNFEGYFNLSTAITEWGRPKMHAIQLENNPFLTGSLTAYSNSYVQGLIFMNNSRMDPRIPENFLRGNMMYCAIDKRSCSVNFSKEEIPEFGECSYCLSGAFESKPLLLLISLFLWF